MFQIEIKSFKTSFFSGNLQMSDSEKCYFIHYFFVYEVILTNDSSKCSYLQLLKTYIDRIVLLVENGIFSSR